MANTGLIVREPSEDPVIVAKRRKLGLIEEAATKFKRIDIKFLTIPAKMDTPDKPAFAILPIEYYRRKIPCLWSAGHYSFNGENAFHELFKFNSDFFGSATANPPSPITDEAEAIAEVESANFDRIMIAWEADWNETHGDPLMIGEIDGVWFLLAKWDTTSLESYVAGN